jgi:prolyl 4-hydroxylase
MSKQPVTPEIRQWIMAQTAAGFDTAALLESMRASGWEYASAVQAIADTLHPSQLAPVLHATEAAAQHDAPHVRAAPRLPGPDLSRSPIEIDAGDCVVRVLMTLSNPTIAVFEGILFDDECDELIELARPRLERSKTVDRDAGGTEINPARSSSGMFFARAENAVCDRIEQRIARLLNWPVENGEGLQILRYTPGAEYRPHYDYFDPGLRDIASILARGGQRVATLIMYLHTTPRGGATIFPDVGLDVAPVKGNAVFFSYDRAHPDTRSLHGGAPVLEGEKWIATKWLREGTFH